MKLFCINMREAADRRQHCESHFAACGLAARGLDVTFVEGFPARLCSIRHVNKNFSLGMVGCYITHERLIEEIARNDYGLTVIMEDDVQLAEGFADFIKDFQAPCDWDVAFIGWYNGDHQPTEPIDDTWERLIDGQGFAWGLHCYIVNGRKGAENILSILHPMWLQIDVQITSAIKHGKLQGLMLRRPLAHQGGFKTQVQGV